MTKWMDFMIESRIICFLWALFLVIGSILSGSSLGMFLLIFSALFAVVSGVLCAISASGLHIEIEMPYQTEKKEKAECSVKLINSSRFPLAYGIIRMTASNLLTGETTQIPMFFSAAARSDESKSLSIRSKYCGVVRLEVQRVDCYDIFRIFRKKAYPAAAEKLFVLPAMKEEAVLEPVRVPKESDSYSEYKQGFDMSETFEIREYQPGDHQKNLHWKLTAKTDRMMVRVGSLPIDRSILVLYDTFYKNPESFCPESLDEQGEDFFCLSKNLLESHMPFTVGWYDVEKEAMAYFEVNTEEAMSEIMENILSMPHNLSDKNVLMRYAESPDRVDFGSIYLETVETPEEIPLELSEHVHVIDREKETR